MFPIPDSPLVHAGSTEATHAQDPSSLGKIGTSQGVLTGDPDTPWDPFQIPGAQCQGHPSTTPTRAEGYTARPAHHGCASCRDQASGTSTDRTSRANAEISDDRLLIWLHVILAPAGRSTSHKNSNQIASA